MALLPGYNPQNLEDVLGQQAQTRTAGINDQYAQARKRLVSREAASGRLMSGVADYPLTDLDTEQGHALSGVQSDLTTTLGGIPAEDWLNSQEFTRQKQIAKQISDAYGPSTLEQVFQGIGTAGRIVGTIVGAKGG